VEDLQGDLEEIFFRKANASAFRAKMFYWRQVISLIFSYAIRRRKESAVVHAFASSGFNLAMIRNYFLTATRNLARQKLFTSLNVFGLAVGMSVCLLFIAMFSFVCTYDNFHTNADRIYRVTSLTDDKQRIREFASTPVPLAEKLESFTGIQKVVRIDNSLRDEAVFLEKKIPLHGYFADPAFLDVFTFPLVEGNPKTALSGPNSILITETAAQKLFAGADPMGKVIEFPSFGIFEVTGILKDVPKNSHMQFEVVASHQALELLTRNERGDAWKEFRDSYIYLLLPKTPDVNAVENYLARISAPAYAHEENFSARFQLQPLGDISPGRDLYNVIGPEWDYTSFVIFGGLTLLILLPACFNYASMSISRALKRMKEIGMRKVMGGQRRQIVFQFVLETVIVCLIALMASFYIFVLIRAEFQSMIADSQALDLTPGWQTIAYFLAFALIVGTFTGLVPALYLSRLTPVQALKGKPVERRTSGFTLRKSLMVMQFALSLGFIMGVVIVLKQYRYAMNYDFGFQQEQLLDVDLQGVDPQVVKHELEKFPPVRSISMASHILGTGSVGSAWVRREDSRDSVEVFETSIDEHYLSNLEIPLVAGRNFQEGVAVNRKQILVNEAFVADFRLGTAHDALGQRVTINDTLEVTIAGVVKNFHYTSLREPIRSFYFRYDPAQFRYANLKLASRDLYGDLSGLESAWKTFGGETKFQAQFFRDEIKDTYSVYFTMVRICGFLGVLAITIACLGLLGMVVFTVENRVKEIGVRKVLGASIGNVTMLLSRDFLKLMGIAAFIAVPLAWFFFEKMYLAIEYYHMSVGILEIVISLVILLTLGLSTILSQTLRAARANPVDALRSE
jgi:ABC-type lipoprotein release transport system permease subunit